ncbi:PstS family phosphate ABC transporter substrate-binding protein [Planctomyces sp. SH-PL62]|uniref:PstS family phosphate ABC transporter substrate-binding protein n=1 Tax=Planctomyces sp. SH-PL62 TaxID=1636152 RepID=UPI00078D8D64|nr:PstS family phosphate ABC transporter substrate-binding protein [Planctomyces sp. SH-PL62]AMV39872.1 Phosphate-binding protein PstS precursor [Planctomyces sp. SH-PL62]
MRSWRERAWLPALSAALAVAGGCGGGDAGPTATIIIDGSSTVFRISKAAQEAFADVDPGVTVVVDNHGTGGGFSRYLQGEVDIVDASRDAKPDEESKARSQGIEWTRLLVGYDGITLAVNAKNDFARALTVEQLKKLWEPDSKVQTWKDLDPTWPDRKIVLYSPDNDSGTFEFFTEAVVGKAGLQREGVQQNSDDNILISGVAGDPDGIGYFGYAYYAANRNRLNALAVQAGPDAPAVVPSPESIADKSYRPLSRPLYLFVKNSAARRPEVGRFLKFYLDEISTLAPAGGYDPPTPEDDRANHEALARLNPAVGTGGDAASPAAETPEAP